MNAMDISFLRGLDTVHPCLRGNNTRINLAHIASNYTLRAKEAICLNVELPLGIYDRFESKDRGYNSRAGREKMQSFVPNVKTVSLRHIESESEY